MHKSVMLETCMYKMSRTYLILRISRTGHATGIWVSLFLRCNCRLAIVPEDPVRSRS